MSISFSDCILEHLSTVLNFVWVLSLETYFKLHIYLYADIVSPVRHKAIPTPADPMRANTKAPRQIGVPAHTVSIKAHSGEDYCLIEQGRGFLPRTVCSQLTTGTRKMTLMDFNALPKLRINIGHI